MTSAGAKPDAVPRPSQPQEPYRPGSQQQPPYILAGVISLVVLAAYLWTLAPTVTFWDAGEFIAAAKILGIPHPPGTPLFVLLASAWAALVPIGEFAFRTNLMTAVFSAAASGAFFLLIHQTLESGELGRTADRIYVLGGAVAAVLAGAFAFTVWQNANETEVYMVATFSIGAICWLGWLWRSKRGTQRAPHLLLLVVYILALSVGNHLLTLLVGPALIVFMGHVIKSDPMQDERDRRIEWAHWTVITGIWAMLVGTGLGNTTLFVLGSLIFVVAAVFAAGAGAFRFALTVLIIAAVGASTYYYLYVRANLGPVINEADPSTWERLLAVIRREQYPPRSPIDNPLFSSGPDNPGRTLSLMLLQVQNYLQYFDWQWSKGLAPVAPLFARPRVPFTLLFTALGVYGARTVYRHDRSVFWLLLVLWLTTGLGLVGYMNFKPGFSIGFDQFPQAANHEVRERDYFFTVSFLVWGLLSGIGIAGFYRWVKTEWSGAVARGAPAVFVLAVLPFALNFSAASRRHGPEAELARDFAYNLLQSVEPYGIIFTNGDNDTFPLWYAQEVEGIRRDVAVVNLSLGNTDWYIRQLRDNEVRPFDPQQAPWYADLAPASAPPPVHSWSDGEISQLVPQVLSRSINFSVGRVTRTFPQGSAFFIKDILTLRLIQENWRTRPIYFAITSGSDSWGSMREYLTQEALVLRLNVRSAPDSSRVSPGLLGVPIDVPRTDSLSNHIYRYAGLLEADTVVLDPTNRNIATNLALPLLSLGQALEMQGRPDRALEYYRKAYQLNPGPQLAQIIQLMEGSLAPPLLPDTANTVDTAESAPN